MFGFSQVTDPSTFLTGRIAQYLSLEQEIRVCIIFVSGQSVYSSSRDVCVVSVCV